MKQELLTQLKKSNKLLQILVKRQIKDSHSEKMITEAIKENSLLIEQTEKGIVMKRKCGWCGHYYDSDLSLCSLCKRDK